MRSEIVACMCFAAASFLAACKPADGSLEADEVLPKSAGTCVAFPAASTVVADVGASCANCLVTDEANAIDDDTSSFAFMDLPVALGGGTAIRAIAPTGTSYTAGKNVGALVEVQQHLSVELASAFAVRTYLGGALQEEETLGGNWGGVVNGTGSTGTVLMSFTTSLPFDSVEFFVGGFFEGLSAQVYELCRDS